MLILYASASCRTAPVVSVTAERVASSESVAWVCVKKRHVLKQERCGVAIEKELRADWLLGSVWKNYICLSRISVRARLESSCG
jgi:hypothetical protein